MIQEEDKSGSPEQCGVRLCASSPSPIAVVETLLGREETGVGGGGGATGENLSCQHREAR